MNLPYRMSLLNKLRTPSTREPNARPANNTGQPLHAPAAAGSAPNAAAPGRFSNGLKEFLWQLHDLKRANLLDLGTVSQTTLNFFIDRGFKVYTEDLLGLWSYHVHAELEKVRTLPADAERPDSSPAARADRFLASNLRHPANTFDAILLWDALDYFD